MTRPLRIAYENAWYHVMNRGRQAEPIYAVQRIMRDFLAILKETIRMWDIRVVAYCLISNHYHLLVQTPKANLSQCMCHINGVYTQHYNRKYHKDGQLFRGQYRAILVDADSYALELMCYVHRNPFRAGIVKKLGGSIPGAVIVHRDNYSSVISIIVWMRGQIKEDRKLCGRMKSIEWELT